jgi:FG-GAP-like repeat
VKSFLADARVSLLAMSVLSLASCGGDDSPPTTNVPNSVLIADFNADGIPDVAAATTAAAADGSTPNPGFASIFLQSRSDVGSFSGGKHFPTGNNPSSIAVGDLTGLSSADLVVANFLAGSVSVLLETAVASGDFLAASNISVGGHPNEVVIADLNGDGRKDLAVADDTASAGRVLVLLQDATTAALFGTPIALSTTDAVAGVAVSDLNGDGKPDIAAATADANGNNGHVVVFFQDPNSAGTFLSPAVFAGGAQPSAVKIADIDGDGLPDLIVANAGPGTDGIGSAGASVLLQDAANPGSFLAPVTYATQSGTVHLVVADLNGDSKPDIVTANLGPSPTGSVSVLLQDPTRPGVFLSPVNYTGFGQPLGVAVGDLNNDGHPDIAVADGTTATMMLQSATAPGTFASGVQIGN